MTKGPNAFRTISEAAEEVGVPQHVLRFWETKFAFVAPLKRAGGRRFYRPDDIAVLRGVRRLLHEQGLTIKGVQRLHKDRGLKAVAGFSGEDAAFTPSTESNHVPARPAAGRDTARLRAVLADLEAARARLDHVLRR
ncbi:MAG: MerR family transcriptional regulator [Brevundimonas sp.]|uniref:MerR family transcriptional regulator n=1 Tax=Brevundimonas sp. TaxID=1871086 RepID=UPI00391AD052